MRRSRLLLVPLLGLALSALPQLPLAVAAPNAGGCAHTAAATPAATPDHAVCHEAGGTCRHDACQQCSHCLAILAVLPALPGAAPPRPDTYRPFDAASLIGVVSRPHPRPPRAGA